MRQFIRRSVLLLFAVGGFFIPGETTQGESRPAPSAWKSYVFKVTVDYDLSFDQMVAQGHYDWVNVGLHPHYFPIKGKGRGEVELELVHFGHTVTDAEVEKFLAKRGLKPASLEHLLAFGARYPKMQKQFPIAAIGSVWAPTRGDRLAPYLDASLRERLLNLSWGKGMWEGKFRFLVVRKN